MTGVGPNVKQRSVYPAVLSPEHLLETFGTIGLMAIIFAETGLLVGFFLPGDSLLLLAGLFCAPPPKVNLNLALSWSGVIVAAIVGAQMGYLIGRQPAPRSSAGPTPGCSNRSTSRRPRPTSPGTAPRRS